MQKLQSWTKKRGHSNSLKSAGEKKGTLKICAKRCPRATKQYIDERKDEITKYRMDIPICDVIFLDSTFCFWNSTKQKNVNSGSYSLVAEDADLFILNRYIYTTFSISPQFRHDNSL